MSEPKPFAPMRVSAKTTWRPSGAIAGPEGNASGGTSYFRTMPPDASSARRPEGLASTKAIGAAESGTFVRLDAPIAGPGELWHPAPRARTAQIATTRRRRLTECAAAYRDGRKSRLRNRFSPPILSAIPVRGEEGSHASVDRPCVLREGRRTRDRRASRRHELHPDLARAQPAGGRERRRRRAREHDLAHQRKDRAPRFEEHGRGGARLPRRRDPRGRHERPGGAGGGTWRAGHRPQGADRRPRAHRRDPPRRPQQRRLLPPPGPARHDGVAAGC